MSDLQLVDTGNPAGPPIVWLGSIGSSAAMWDRQLPAFDADHRCVLIEHPGQMTHASVTGTQAEVEDTLLRLSVGIENEADLIGDLKQALEVVVPATAIR